MMNPRIEAHAQLTPERFGGVFADGNVFSVCVYGLIRHCNLLKKWIAGTE